MQFESMPDGWTEITYEVGPSRGDQPYTEELNATWVSEDEHLYIRTKASVDSTDGVTYPIRVEQELSVEHLSTFVQTDATVGSDRRNAEELVVEFMESIDRSDYDIRAIGASGPNENGFIEFFTIYNSELPGDMTALQLIETIEQDSSPEQIDGLPDDIEPSLADEELIQIDVFPRYKDTVDGYAENTDTQ